MHAFRTASVLPVAILLAGCPPETDPKDSATPTDDTALPTDDTGTEPQGTWATILGNPADALGNAVQGAGDLDADGDDDFLAAAYLGNRVCAIFGPVPAGRSVLDDLGPACFVGEGEYDYAGYGMAAVGDATGDGIGDVMVGSIGNSDTGTNAGKAYLLAGPFTAGSAVLSDIAYAAWRGETGSDYAGIAVGAAGDLTGDGVVDLLVGASGYDGEDGGGGRAYLLAGPFGGGTFSLADAYGTITGLGTPDTTTTTPPHGSFGTGDFVGDARTGRGDYNGDGIDDLALGASGDATLGPGTGKVLVFSGPLDPGAWLATDADVTLEGPAAGSYAGSPIAASPDMTGDGVEDLLVAADGYGAGVVYLASPIVAGAHPLADAAIRFDGETEDDMFGYGLAAPGDFNGDGALDVAISGPSNDRFEYEAGATWVFSGPFPDGAHSTAEAAAFGGEMEGDSYGSDVDAGGDLDGDGDADLVVGARNSDGGGGFSGKLYLIDP